MKNLKGLLLLVALVWAAQSAWAQKYGHINSGNLMELMPEVKQADDTLAAMQKTMLAKGEQLVNAFEEKYRKLEADIGAGNVSAIDRQKREDELRKEQEVLQNYEGQMQLQLGQKREALLTPLLDRLKKAIQDVGKEGGYTMVFDVSGGALLFVNDSDDILPLVKKKLNLQ